MEQQKEFLEKPKPDNSSQLAETNVKKEKVKIERAVSDKGMALLFGKIGRSGYQEIGLSGYKFINTTLPDILITR
ncbi:hypothetical protein KACHI17_12850 [Sediminibacterium sp. KACHI17]|uniref:Uncharacterized protein n=1 Tax=Sediminibacterium sp. KACHI17 TaxID=1751071 RepID=A0AAT9GIE6_9BACT